MPVPVQRSEDGFLRTPRGQLLGLTLGRPVVDLTGLQGYYAIALEFSRESIGPGAGGGNPAEALPDSNDSGPTIFTALQEQLGLKLESRKGLAMLVADSVEKMPARN